MINFKTKNLSILALALSIIIILPSCNDDDNLVVDFGNLNYYFIDNQSSHDLTFEFSDPIVEISTGERVKFWTAEFLGDSGFGIPFQDAMDDSEDGVYLYRDSNGVNIEALKLYESVDLNWSEKTEALHVYHHTLVVTDEMIK